MDLTFLIFCPNINFFNLIKTLTINLIFSLSYLVYKFSILLFSLHISQPPAMLFFCHPFQLKASQISIATTTISLGVFIVILSLSNSASHSPLYAPPHTNIASLVVYFFLLILLLYMCTTCLAHHIDFFCYYCCYCCFRIFSLLFVVRMHRLCLAHIFKSIVADIIYIICEGVFDEACRHENFKKIW
jgi:hypothetical protein